MSALFYWTGESLCLVPSSISPIAIRMMCTALPITSAGRFSPFGPFGNDFLRSPGRRFDAASRGADFKLRHYPAPPLVFAGKAGAFRSSAGKATARPRAGGRVGSGPTPESFACNSTARAAAAKCRSSTARR